MSNLRTWALRSAFLCGAVACLSSGLTVSAATVEVATQPVGLMQIAIQPGANFISAPLHRIHAYRGAVATVGSSSLTVGGNPGWTANQFASQDGYYQFIVLLRKRTGAGATHEGDWWPIVSNDAGSLTVAKRTEDLSTILQPGDQVEIRHLTTIKDLFGTGASTVLNKDRNGFGSPAEEDVIRYVVGTHFSTDIIYHDGTLAPEGYYANGDGPFDGSTLTLWPDQAFMVFRKTGASTLNIRVLGQVQTTHLTHYLQAAINPIGTGFATSAPINASGLFESGWKGDVNGFASPSEEDVVRSVVGTHFDKDIFYHNGQLADPGWYVNGSLDNTFPFEPGKGYFVFIKGPGPLRWSQAAPQ